MRRGDTAALGWVLLGCSAGACLAARRSLLCACCAPAVCLLCACCAPAWLRSQGCQHPASGGHAAAPAARRQLMLEAQREFDARAGPMCPEQLTAPVLHRVLAHPPLQVGVPGCQAASAPARGLQLWLDSMRLAGRHCAGCWRVTRAQPAAPGLLLLTGSTWPRCCAGAHLGLQGRGLAGRRHSAVPVQERGGAAAGLQHPRRAAGPAVHAAHGSAHQRQPADVARSVAPAAALQPVAVVLGGAGWVARLAMRTVQAPRKAPVASASLLPQTWSSCTRRSRRRTRRSRCSSASSWSGCERRSSSRPGSSCSWRSRRCDGCRWARPTCRPRR